MADAPKSFISDPYRYRRNARFAALSCASVFMALPGFALADCVADSSGLVVNCSGTSAGYTNSLPGVSVAVATGTTVTGPIIVGDTGTITNTGSVTGVAGTPTLQLGSLGVVTNNGTISSIGSTAGSAGVALGDYGVLTNNGSLTAVAGTGAALFGRGGSFMNSATATAAVTGYISFGPSIGTDVSTFNNYNSAFGITGNITASGNAAIYNNGLLTGSIIQTASGGTVAITNDTAGIYTGAISTGDITSLLNNGSMTITGASALGSARLGASSLSNQGSLTVGSSTTPVQLAIYGSFAQGASGTLNIGLRGSGTLTPVAGSSYSQVYATGANGTATLGGTLNLVPAPGFYPSGSTYNVVLADQGITGNFSSITGNTLPFITFAPNGIVTIAGAQQAFQFTAIRSTTYAAVIASVATPNQIAVATAFNPIVNTANTSPNGDAAILVGGIDLLTVAQAQALFDQVSPEGYLAYGTALRDQMNLFNRQVALRLNDQNTDHAQHGWWANAAGQGTLGSTGTYGTKNTILNANAGYDFSGPHYVVGVAGGYSSAALTYAPGSLTGHNNAYTMGAYGSYKIGRLMASGQVDYDLGNFTSTKTITIGAATRTATAGARDHLFKATGTFSIDLGNANIMLAPFAQIDYAKGGVNGFTEAGATSANLTVSGFGADRTDAIGGIYVTKKQGHWRPYVRVDYRSQVGTGSNPTIAAYLNNDTTTAFTITGAGASRKQVDVDAGLNVVYEGDGALFVGYQGTYRGDAKANGINAGIRVSF